MNRHKTHTGHFIFEQFPFEWRESDSIKLRIEYVHLEKDRSGRSASAHTLTGLRQVKSVGRLNNDVLKRDSLGPWRIDP